MSKRRIIRPLLSVLLVCALIVPVIATPALAYAPYPLQPTDTEIAEALDYLHRQLTGVLAATVIQPGQ